MCVALVGKGEKDEGLWACDIASLLFPSDHLSLLLIKVRYSTLCWSLNFTYFQVVVLFMAGEHLDAISRLGDLIADAGVDPKLYVVQARETCPYIR